MGEVSVGPTVTQFTFKPADGIKLTRITALHNDLALALAAHPIRMEAPIPGKSLVGIEVPNLQSAKVNMGEMLLSKDYKSRTNNLSIALGKDVSGKPIFAILDKMPHLLIAGATGSGKSVCVNSIIISLMYQNSPDELKFILVDPKRVELPVYNGIPYLLTPVITDVKKTIGALKWAIVEMERRFELLSKFGNRNIASYNQTHADKLPYIIIIIDELADLMATSPNDMEAGIVRLAQMARAVGIHLILATQRPSTEVITGLIKANIPARISFSVASSIDSRTILDGSGAEKLVGRGDMLYLGPELTKPRRLQGVFVSDKEIADVIRFIKSHGEAEYDEKLLATAGSGLTGGSGLGSSFGDNSDEPLINEAIEVIRESGKASASLLQRRLKLGYARAARILDLLEEKGMIGPSDGAKPREVFLDQLGGVGAVEFAAREHNLTGELRPMERDEEEEPTFTSFTRGVETAPEIDNSEETTETEETESEQDKNENKDEEEGFSADFLAVEETAVEENVIPEIDEIEETIIEETKEEPEAIEEAIEKAAAKEAKQKEEREEEIAAEEVAEEEEIAPAKNKSGKKFFDEDEWT
jgi:S-DNA-T family DNA segregation ATPase FtsK/SpoIIIE